MFPECNYFNYDARFHEAEHRCYLLQNNGTKARKFCCADEHYADLAQTLPGYTAGVAPRTRNMVFGARVLVSTTSLRADESNAYVVEFQLSLGAKPMRGAVWIEPEMASMTALNYSLTPKRVVLYDEGVRTTVRVQIYDADLVKGVGETLVIVNKIQSCDTAFTSLGSAADSVFVRVVVPQTTLSTGSLIVGVASSLVALAVALSIYLYFDKQHLAKLARKNDLGEDDRDEIFEVQRLLQKDNLQIVIGRVVVITLSLTACVFMPLWLRNLNLKQMDDTQNTERDEKIYVLTLSAILLIILAGILVYDWMIRRRNRKLLINAAKSNEIMATLFPDGIRARLLDETRTAAKAKNGQVSNEILADLYPRTTVCFLDIVGFTSWCSSRQPTQVRRYLMG